jgi:hypothetical protein
MALRKPLELSPDLAHAFVKDSELSSPKRTATPRDRRTRGDLDVVGW